MELQEEQQQQLQEAEKKFKKLQRYIPFLETFTVNYSTQLKNDVVAKKLSKAGTLLKMLKDGFKK